MFHPRGTVHESHVLEGVQKENLIQDRSAPLGQTDRWWIRLWQTHAPLRGVFVLFLLRLKDSLIDLSCFPPFPFLSSNEIQGIWVWSLIPNGSINCSARTNWLILSNHASSLPTNMWTVKVLCFIRATYMPKPLCSCILADMMLRCFSSEGLCLYRFVCLAFRCIICEGLILTSVPKQFGSFSYSLHILLSQLSPVLLPESPTWFSQGRSCLWNLQMHHFVCRECQNHYCLLLFWGFTWLFGAGTLLWAVVCEKEASLFHRSEVRNYWVTGWAAEGVGY